jgi:hypothetical protein
MKAVVFHGVGDIRLDEVPEPKIQEPTDAIVKLTSSAICGTDLHMVRGTLAGMKPGTILGHEGVGYGAPSQRAGGVDELRQVLGEYGPKVSLRIFPRTPCLRTSEGTYKTRKRRGMGKRVIFYEAHERGRDPEGPRPVNGTRWAG